MTIHQCPKCELRFEWKTELDDHCRRDHPQFRHDYPAEAPPSPPQAEEPAVHHSEYHPHPHHIDGGEFVRWLVPPKRQDR